MKNWIYAFLGSLLLTAIVIGCTKKEALNLEADITSATVPNAQSLLQMDPTIGNTTVTFRLRNNPDSYLFAPEFKLSKGAKIQPASGTQRDFTSPQTYVVTSESGDWQKEYTVSFIAGDNGDGNGDGGDDGEPAYYYYSFQEADVHETNKYHMFFDYGVNNQKVFNWSSGNDGYSIIAGNNKSPEIYPTAQINDGYQGKAAKLQTYNTGSMGALMGSPLAAGNLFIGVFELAVPSIKSIKLGLPYTLTKAPKVVKGYFKYKAGENFVVNNGPSNLTEDSWDAYAILFEKTANNNFLSGDHGFTDPRIVSIARIKPADRIETNSWTAFEMEFENQNGKQFDPTKEYMYTIVFSSSIEGGDYNGATESTLWIDEVYLIEEE